MAVDSIARLRPAGADLLSLYREMARARVLGDDAVTLQRLGVLPAFAPCTGQEAAQIGSAMAMDRDRDFVFPTYREFAAMMALGVSPVALLAHHRGYADGGLFDPLALHVAPLYASVGATVLHAVGWALGATLDGDPACALAYFGDGASSQGDVHEAMNFAGVLKCPVVFFCQNNQWAISVPVWAQVAGGSVASRAAGYGLPGVKVDGNDVEAVLEATGEAVARARAGGGATVIEAMTYRLGPHATSDDPGRYRTAEEEERWHAQDPLLRGRAKLLATGQVDDTALAEIDRELQDEAATVRTELAELGLPSFAARMQQTYRDVPPSVSARGAAWLGELADV